MKVLAHINGTAGLQVSVDDVVPKNSFMARDLIDFIMSAYQFAVGPNIPPGIPPFALPAFTFQSGVFVKEDTKTPVIQLSILANGELVTAQTTELADIIMDDILLRLDEKFGYRFSEVKNRRIYHSNIAVRFERGVEEIIEPVKTIENILNQEMKRPEKLFKIKRLAFGNGEVNVPPTMSFEGLDNADFLIERRAQEPYSENRYFCSAPMRTADHIKVLEKIEKELKS